MQINKQKMHFLHHHPLQNHQNITSKTTSKTFHPCTLLPQHVPSLRVPFSGHPPPDPLPTHFVRQAQLSWCLLRRLAFVMNAMVRTDTAHILLSPATLRGFPRAPHHAMRQVFGACGVLRDHLWRRRSPTRRGCRPMWRWKELEKTGGAD